MRLRITLSFQNQLTLPTGYNHILQGFLYHNLSQALATKLHEEGYVYQDKVFRNVTFSNLQGTYRIAQGQITFFDKVSLHLSSPNTEVLSQFAQSMLQKELELAGQSVRINSVEVQPIPKFSTIVTIRMLSPMTIYSTFTLPPNRKKTYYYSPHESDFSPLIEANLNKKYKAFYPEFADKHLSLKIIPLNISKRDEKIIKYKDFIIKGWAGAYRLEGDLEAIEFAWLAGLGGKNAQGLGCWEINHA